MTPFARLRAWLSTGRSEAPPAPAAPPPGAIPVSLAGEAPQVPSVPPAAVEIVARFEGFRERAYRCPAGVWTIGFGATIWGDRRPVREGDVIDEDAARRLLARDLADAAEAVADLVRVPLTDNAFAALISFTFNVGRGAFARSTMLTHINAGRLDSAAAEFPRWIHAGGQASPAWSAAAPRKRACSARSRHRADTQSPAGEIRRGFSRFWGRRSAFLAQWPSARRIAMRCA